MDSVFVCIIIIIIIIIINMIIIFNIHGSVHRSNLVVITNEMQLGNGIYYFLVH